MNTSSNVVAYTDGACKGNPGKGGWGVYLQAGTHTKELFGGVAGTTNNRMELTACIEALSALTRPCEITIITDSSYVKDGITKWVYAWRRNSWKTKTGSEVKNKDLWQKLESLTRQHNVGWQWVKGHSGDAGNERADLLANKGAAQVGV